MPLLSSVQPLVLIAAVTTLVAVLFAMSWFSSTAGWKPEGKNVLITGGSQGLGLALAEHLAAEGANVTICARTEAKLVAGVSSIKARARSPAQVIQYVAADVSTFVGAREAVASASESAVPDTVFCCAGGARPGFFLQQDEADFLAGIQTDYLTALATAHAAAHAMAKAYAATPRRSQRPKIVLVSSTLGFMGLVGYAQYTPMKHAIRGLAESLRSELLLYGIDVHAYFPATILSPGFEQENKTKPTITRQIEGVDEGLTPEQCAKRLVKGLSKDHFFITSDTITHLFRASALGSAPTNHGLWDRVLAVVAWIALPIWRRFEADKAIKAHRAAHLKELGLAPAE